ncbi:hypothetical protein ACWCQV_27660, partial [Streptomyces eurythermus]
MTAPPAEGRHVLGRRPSGGAGAQAAGAAVTAVRAAREAARSTAARARAATAGGVFRPALRHEGTDPHTLAALAAAGHGLALLPRSAATGA